MCVFRGHPRVNTHTPEALPTLKAGFGAKTLQQSSLGLRLVLFQIHLHETAAGSDSCEGFPLFSGSSEPPRENLPPLMLSQTCGLTSSACFFPASLVRSALVELKPRILINSPLKRRLRFELFLLSAQTEPQQHRGSASPFFWARNAEVKHIPLRRFSLVSR